MTPIFDYIVHSCYASHHWVPTVTHLDFNDNRYSIHYIASLNTLNPFQKFIKIPLAGDVLEIPCAYKYIATNLLSKNKEAIESNKKDVLYIPLTYSDTLISEAKSSPTAIRALFYDYHSTNGLARKKVSGTWYIGGEGILLYEDLTPLIMFTLKLSKTPEGVYQPIQQILRINPTVFEEDDALSKYVRGKFITNILKVKNSVRYLSPLRNPYGILEEPSFLDWNITVLIEDFSQFFVTPKIPDSSFSDEKANALLKDNLSSILTEIDEHY